MLGQREKTSAAGFLCRSLDRIVNCLDDPTDDEVRWRPPAPAANSLGAIAWHALGNAEDNIIGLLGGSRVDRQRTAEFDDSRIGLQVMRDPCARLELDLTDALKKLPAEVLVRELSHPRRGQLTGFEVLVVALRHATEHISPAELTRDLILAHQTESG